MTETTQDLVKIRHAFLDHRMDPETEIVILGTFNPGPVKYAKNVFFYSSGHNQLWQLLPAAFGEGNLRESGVEERKAFMKRHHVDFIDIIAEVQVDRGNDTRDDRYLDIRVTEWNDVIAQLENLRKLRAVLATRKAPDASVKNISQRMMDVRTYCKDRGVIFESLFTPSPAARVSIESKQVLWDEVFARIRAEASAPQS